MEATDDRGDSLLEELLGYIQQGAVVPVIGPGLCRVRSGEKDLPLSEFLAERLVAPLGVAREALPEAYTMDDVVAAYLDMRKPLQRVYSRVHALLQEARLTPPPALQQLAAISGFQLYVTTCYDGLLADALRAQRGKVETCVYARNEASDLPSDHRRLARPTVFHLFGQSTAEAHQYAVTEEDTLEYLCALQTEGRRPPRLFDALRERHLLLIGCNFSDWLARLFLRTARNSRPSSQHEALEYLVEPGAGAERSFVHFVRRFSRHTELFADRPEDFVQRLSDGWKSQAQPAAGQPQSGAEGMPANAVFISYASEARAAAQRIKQQLDEARVAAWLDREDLRAGDNYAHMIEDHVRRSGYFLPIVSEHTQVEEKRWFRREWAWALECDAQLSSIDRYIVPVSVDKTDHKAARLPPRFREVQWLNAPDGQFPPEQAARLRELFPKAVRS